LLVKKLLNWLGNYYLNFIIIRNIGSRLKEKSTILNTPEKLEMEDETKNNAKKPYL